MHLVDELKGSFMAANILSRLMHSSMDARFWRRVLEVVRRGVRANYASTRAGCRAAAGSPTSAAPPRTRRSASTTTGASRLGRGGPVRRGAPSFPR